MKGKSGEMFVLPKVGAAWHLGNQELPPRNAVGFNPVVLRGIQ